MCFLSPALRRIVTALSAGSALIAAAGEPVILRDFSDSARYTVRKPFAVPSPDGATLRIDTTASGDEWTPVFLTAPGMLKPSTTYVATFRCRVDGPDMNTKYLCFLSRPASSGNGALDTMFERGGGSASFRPVRIKFRTGNAADYAFQIHTYRQLKGEISDFRLVEQSREDSYYPAVRNAAPYTGPWGALPTGAKEFSIDQPSNPGGSVVRAADFGVSADAADNVDALNRALEHCRKNGAAKLVVAPGTYRMTADRPVNLERMQNFIFDGGGATFVWHKKREANFRLNGCERIVMRNFKMDWDWEKDPLASLVEVVGASAGHVDFRFNDYETFPRRDVRVIVVSSYDPATKSVGIEGGFDCFAGQHGAETEWLSGNVLRMHGKNLPLFRKGQLFRMQHYYYNMDGFAMSDNRHLTLEDIDIYSCAGSAFVISGVQQYWEFRRVNIAAPEGMARRLITCAGDHCHIRRSRGFFRMEDCEFSLGADDCLNVHDTSGYAEKSGTHSVTTRNVTSIDTFRPGAPVELRHGDYSPAGFRSAIRSIRPVDEEKGMYEITFEEPVPEPVDCGFVLFNWTYDTRNIIVRNCFFHDNRARGVLLLGRDITLENNHFRHNDMGAVKIETGYTFNLWSEGYGADNIVVRNNRFDSVNPRGAGSDGKARDIYMGVYMETDPSTLRTDYPILSNILFENNTFKDSYGLVAFISSAGNVTFRDNTFVNPTPRREPLPCRAAFYVTNANGVRIVNNRYIASPNVPNPGVYADPDSVKGLVAAGNTVVSE